MARIVEKQILITISKIAKDSEGSGIDLAEDFNLSLESIVQELLQDNAMIVEVDVLSGDDK